MPYIGRGPELGVRSRFIYTATANQTSFSGNDDAGISLAYTDTLYMDVYQNGVLLVPATDYAATTGTSVVLVQGASVDDTVELLVFDIFSVADSVSKKDGGAFSGNLSATDITATATLNAQGDTAAGDNAAIGYTAAEGLILTGQGSTDDITIKNDADTTVLNVATGGTDVEISAGNLLFGTADKGVYLGVTSATAANLLDDYEEGTWTPVFVSTSATFSYSVQLGSYVKVGNLVTLWFNITLNGTPGGTTSNTVNLGTLPFASKAIDGSLYSGGHVGHYSNINVNTGTSVAYQNSAGSATTVELKEIGDAQGENSVVASELTNGTFIRGSIFYRSA